MRRKSVFITGKLNHRPPLSSVPYTYIYTYVYMIKHLYQYFGSLDTVRKSFLNEAADFHFHVCVFWVIGYSEERFPK